MKTLDQGTLTSLLSEYMRDAVTASAASLGGWGVKSGYSFTPGGTQSKATRRILDKWGFNTEAVGHRTSCIAV